MNLKAVSAGFLGLVIGGWYGAWITAICFGYMVGLPALIIPSVLGSIIGVVASIHVLTRD